MEYAIMTEDKRQDFLQKLRESKNKYVNSLPSKISEIRLIWNQLNTNEWRVAVLSKMQNLAHNLAGSGGTFGLPALSDIAKNLELSLMELSTSGDKKPDQSKIIAIDDLLIELQRVELETIRESESPTETTARSNTIFILDKDKEHALNMLRQLMYYGCTVKIISDIKSVETELRHELPMVVIIEEGFADEKLHNRSIMQTMRKDWGFTCPIIYFSASDTFDSRMQAIKANANAYFTKPIDVALLVERINILTNTSMSEPYRILIVEDDEELAKFYSLTLEKGGMKVFIEQKPERALETILQTNPELVVMDLYMPNYNGIELIKLIRQHQALYTLPVVLLTSETDVNMQFLAREVGVDDFLNKPIEPVHFYDSVLNRVQRARYTNASMSKDSLTGLFSHKKIYEQLRLSLNISARYNQPLTYAIIDLDDFKHVNDSYGHITGDNVLIALSNTLKSSVRSSDFVGRYGGEEFVIIFPETTEKAAYESLERIREKFAQTPHYANGEKFHITLSAGIASYPKHGDLDTIMVVADEALYLAKNKGKNQIVIG